MVYVSDTPEFIDLKMHDFQLNNSKLTPTPLDLKKKSWGKVCLHSCGA